MPEQPESPAPTPAPVCRRCGQCCRAGGPALHLADLPLVRSGTLLRAHLVTLRRGETVNENVTGKRIVLTQEMVKIAGQEKSRACFFHDATLRACRIHPNHPLECRTLFCEDTAAIRAIYQQDRLTRADILNARGGLWELTRFHDQTFPADTAADLARKTKAGRGGAKERLLAMARAETSFRQTFQEKTGAAVRELDFYFGRSLTRICLQFGIRLAL